MSRWVHFLAVFLLAVVTGGCAVAVSGTPAGFAPSTRRLADPDRIHTDDALGDLATWNPCSVVDPDNMPTGWTAELDIPVAFEYCLLTVTAITGAQADVEVGYPYRSTHDLAQYQSGVRQGGLTVVPDDLGEGDCTRDIVFADGIAVQVRSWPYDTDANAHNKACEIGDVVVDQVVDAVVAGKAETLRLPKNSLGDIDPCSLVTREMAAIVPGITAAVPAESQVSRHSCWWQSPDGPMLDVEFVIGRLPTGDSGDTRHGRYTTVTRYPGDEKSSLCEVAGEHVPFPHESATGLKENVNIYVYLAPGQLEAACTAASALADALWPKLPPR